MRTGTGSGVFDDFDLVSVVWFVMSCSALHCKDVFCTTYVLFLYHKDAIIRLLSTPHAKLDLRLLCAV